MAFRTIINKTTKRVLRFGDCDYENSTYDATIEESITGDFDFEYFETEDYFHDVVSGFYMKEYTEEELWTQQEPITRKLINKKTDDIIANGFWWNDIKFAGDIEHQMSYKASHDLREELSYPYTIKGVGGGYYQMSTSAEFHGFFLSGMQTIEGYIQYGWYLKDGLTGMTHAELTGYVDPR